MSNLNLLVTENVCSNSCAGTRFHLFIGYLAVLFFFVVIACSETDNSTPDDFQDYPGARGATLLIPHLPTGSVIMFGGESNSRFSYEATWSYNVAENSWTRFETDVHPVKAGGMAAAYDDESDRIIFLFNSRLDSSAPMGLVRLTETWAFDVSSATWTDMNPTPTPFGLMGVRMVYDSESDRIILFGGADFTKGLKKADWFNSTWTYDFNSNTWAEMNPDVAPPGRAYFAMSYDSAADRVLAFSGSPSDAAASMWAYDYNSNSWEAIQYSGDVQPDHHPFMVYAPNLDRTLYMVNESFSAFDYSTRTWKAFVRDPELGVRYRLAMAFDEASQKVVVFGGGPRVGCATITKPGSTIRTPEIGERWVRNNATGQRDCIRLRNPVCYRFKIMKVSVYIATSLDGFIARENGDLDWLPGSDGKSDDEVYGFHEFMDSIDVLVMGRNTFEMVLSFGKWPFGSKRVEVLSSKLIRIPDDLAETVESRSCTPTKLVKDLIKSGAQHLYIDGGKTIQGFLNAGLIQEIIITRIPILIGSGIPLFGPLNKDRKLGHIETRSFANGFIQSRYEVLE